MSGETGSGRSSAIATLAARVDLASAASHYRAVLESAGWTCTDEKQTTNLAWWGTWDLPNDEEPPMTGFLGVLRVPWLEDRLHLEVRAMPQADPANLDMQG